MSILFFFFLYVVVKEEYVNALFYLGLSENYCRNPNNRTEPWCFYYDSNGTMGWGYCMIPACKLKTRIILTLHISLSTVGRFSTVSTVERLETDIELVKICIWKFCGYFGI